MKMNTKGLVAMLVLALALIADGIWHNIVAERELELGYGFIVCGIFACGFTTGAWMMQAHLQKHQNGEVASPC